MDAVLEGNETKSSTSENISLNDLNSDFLFTEETRIGQVEVNSLLNTFFPPEARAYYAPHVELLSKGLQNNQKEFHYWFGNKTRQDPWLLVPGSREYKGFKGNLHEIAPGIPVFVLDRAFFEFGHPNALHAEAACDAPPKGVLADYLQLHPKNPDKISQQIMPGSDLAHEVGHLFYRNLERNGVIPQATERGYDRFRDETAQYLITTAAEGHKAFSTRSAQAFLSKEDMSDPELVRKSDQYIRQLGIVYQLGLEGEEAKTKFYSDVLQTKNFSDLQTIINEAAKLIPPVKQPNLSTLAHDWFYQLDRDSFSQTIKDLKLKITDFDHLNTLFENENYTRFGDVVEKARITSTFLEKVFEKKVALNTRSLIEHYYNFLPAKTHDVLQLYSKELPQAGSITDFVERLFSKNIVEKDTPHIFEHIVQSSPDLQNEWQMQKPIILKRLKEEGVESYFLEDLETIN